MKTKILSVFLSVIWSLIMIAVFGAMALAHLYPDNSDLTLFCFFEKEAYVLCGACYLYIFSRIVMNVESRAGRIVMSVLCSFVCAVQVYMLNNLWHYIDYNILSDWEFPDGYGFFLRADLGYTELELAYRYPLVFTLMLVACLSLSVFWPMLKPKIEELMIKYNLAEKS